MKKIFFVAACSALVLSSCSNEIEQCSSVSTMNPKSITVSTYIPGLTRATVANNESVQENGFWMYAVEEGSETPFINVAYAYDGSDWKATDENTYYWPDNAAKFYGLYQVPGLTPELEDASTIITKGTVAVNAPDGDTDVMIANITEEYNKPLSLSTNQETVNLHFEHILADVEVQVVGEKTGYDYIVYGVSLQSASTGFFSLAQGQFTTFQGTKTYFLNEAEDTQEGDELTFDVENAIEINAEEAKIIGAEGNESVMILPSNDIELSISYQIKAGDVVVSEYVNKTKTLTTIQAGFKNIVKVTLKPGKAEIKVNTTVSEWQESADPTLVDMTNN